MWLCLSMYMYHGISYKYQLCYQTETFWTLTCTFVKNIDLRRAIVYQSPERTSGALCTICQGTNLLCMTILYFPSAKRDLMQQYNFFPRNEHQSLHVQNFKLHAN